MVAPGSDLDWQQPWRSALELWGVTLHEPELVSQDAPPSFAWFAFPPAITIDVPALFEAGADAELESVFAHEIGHHVLAPSTRIDSLKIRHQLGRALTVSNRRARPDLLALLSNLWSDQLINLRVAALQRRREPAPEPGMIRLWRRLSAGAELDPLSWVLRRAYELAWALPAGTLCASTPPMTRVEAPGPSAKEREVAGWGELSEADRRLVASDLAITEREAAERAFDTHVVADPTADAHLLARLTRVFADDPIAGALSFGMLVAPYLASADAPMAGLGCAGESAPAPVTASEIGEVLGDQRLNGRPVHPASDPALGSQPAEGEPVMGTPDGSGATASGGQGLGLAETLELYDPALGDAVVAAWYRHQARPWVRPLTERRASTDGDDLPGPLELWELGDDLADLDWPATLTAAPEILPGVSTRRRSRLDDPARPREATVSLDLYIDSSGSMPQPRQGSPAVLAGAILALSVLRGGGSVRATSWASPGQVAGPERYGRDAAEVMASIAFFFGGGTSFPLDLLQRRYAGLAPVDDVTRRHLVVLSDDGLSSMFGVGNDPYGQVAARIRPMLTTATLVLLDPRHRVAPLASRAGYDVSYLESMDDAPAACARLAEVIHG